jgi:hypothetical protein
LRSNGSTASPKRSFGVHGLTVAIPGVGGSGELLFATSPQADQE